VLGSVPEQDLNTIVIAMVYQYSALLNRVATRSRVMQAKPKMSSRRLSCECYVTTISLVNFKTRGHG
jgi:hypothetical protein